MQKTTDHIDGWSLSEDDLSACAACLSGIKDLLALQSMFWSFFLS